MNISKVWIFVLGLIGGAVFLGDNGGEAIKDMFAGVRAGASAIMNQGGEGMQTLGEGVAE